MKVLPSPHKASTQSVWSPCSYDGMGYMNLQVEKASGAWIMLESGERLLDASSSWWTKSFGHGHPSLKKALTDQLDCYEHVMQSQLISDTARLLSEELLSFAPHLAKVFYAGDGASAVEIAMKMSIHARHNKQEKRTHFAALSGSYHGETAAALSVTDIPKFRDAYASLLHDVTFIKAIPYVSGEEDPLWSDAEFAWRRTEKQLTPIADQLTAVIIEPVLQASGGMRLYSADFLKRLERWCRNHNVHLIADEIMTGFCRTGRFFASDHANLKPDMICVGKGMTSGMLPMSAVMASEPLFDACYNGLPFLHSHTFSAYALGASVAYETCQLARELDAFVQQKKSKKIFEAMTCIANHTGRLHNLRHLGMMVAADIDTKLDNATLQQLMFEEGIRQGILIRPIGKTLYWTPPLNITWDEIDHMRESTDRVLRKVIKNEPYRQD